MPIKKISFSLMFAYWPVGFVRMLVMAWHSLAAKIRALMPMNAMISGYREVHALSDTSKSVAGSLYENGQPRENLGNYAVMLAEVSQSLARINDQQALCNAICRIIVTHAHCNLAWIGFIEGESRYIRICAKAGKMQHYLRPFEPVFNLAVKRCDAEPALKAMIRGEVVVVNDAFLLKGGSPQRPGGAAEIRACAAFPLFQFKQAVGVFGVYAGQTNFFRGEIVKALQEVSSDLSFAMETIYLDAVRKNTEQALKESEERFRHINEATGSYIWEIDPQGYYTYVSDKSESVKGYAAEALLGRRLYDFLAEDDALKIREAISSAMADKNKFHLIVRNITPSGAIFWEEMHCIVLMNESGGVEKVRGAGMSANERVKADAEIQHLAYYDPLTDLPNRRMIVDNLKQAVASARRRNTYGALLFFDIDNFKNLNDSLGHDAGDELLKAIARRLNDHIREEDVAARLGGDEFLVLLKHLGNSWEDAASHARLITEKIQAALRVPYRIRNIEYYSSNSIGITLFPQPDADVETLIKQADTALYRAKDAGRDQLRFFHPEMQQAANERLQIEKNIHSALEEGRLRIFYQPQYNSSGKMLGVEALLRCFDPAGRYIPVEKFLPIAEETGLIVELGNWLLQTATRQFMQWQQNGMLGDGIQLCVNISAKQFKQQTFIADIMQILNASGFTPRQLVIEVTETLFIHNFTEVAEKMRQLQHLGVKVAIDDFGTGYSSLLLLKDLPLSQLKIGNTFIEHIENDSGDRTVIEAIIAMGRYLALNIIAEGVENSKQLRFLKSKGCHNFQGYYFSRPLDAAAFEDYLKQRQ
ncbi:MAG: EAL domain-containing protein [Gammaproteobacteria bacterium]